MQQWWKNQLLAQALVKELANAGVEIIVEWVPSHGKHPEWTPGTVLTTATEARHLNARADEAAQRRVELMMRDTAAHRDRRRESLTWSKKALMLASCVEEQMEQFYRGLVRREDDS